MHIISFTNTRVSLQEYKVSHEIEIEIEIEIEMKQRAREARPYLSCNGILSVVRCSVQDVEVPQHRVQQANVAIGRP